MDLLDKNTQDLSKLTDAVNDMRSSLTIMNHDMKAVREDLHHFEPYIEKIKKLEMLVKLIAFVVPVFTAILSGWLGYDVGLYQTSPADMRNHLLSVAPVKQK